MTTPPAGYLRAVLLCDDVRVEVDGTLTILGMYNERLIAPASSGPVELARLVVLVVIAGLTGAHEIAVRYRITPAGAVPPPQLPYLRERHDPAADEHNVIFALGPLGFGGPGAYDLVVELEGATTRRYRFSVTRALVSPTAGDRT